MDMAIAGLVAAHNPHGFISGGILWVFPASKNKKRKSRRYKDLATGSHAEGSYIVIPKIGDEAGQPSQENRDHKEGGR